MTASNITIALTRYNEPNWVVWQALQSLSRQEHMEAEVLFMDQASDEQTRSYLESLNSESIRFTYERIPIRSLSFARNYAIGHSKNDFILYMDSDGIADKQWAYFLSQSLSHPETAIVGGRVRPLWHKKPPWIMRSNSLREQYSLLDLGPQEMAFSRVIGVNFGLDRKALADEAYFNEKLGRRKGMFFGGEETDLCRRATANGLKVSYNGLAVVKHQILKERITYKWMAKRVYYAGINRALRGGYPSPIHPMNFWDYAIIPLMIPWYMAGYQYGLWFAGSIRSHR